MFKKPPPKRSEEPDSPPHYYDVELTPAQRTIVLEALLKYPSATKARKEAIAAVELATRVDLPLADRLEWGELEAEARRQGCSFTDVWFDRMGGR